MSGFEPERGSADWHQQRRHIERGSEAWERLHGTAPLASRKWYTKKRHVIPAVALALLIYRIGTTPPLASSGDDTSWDRSISSDGLDTADRSMGFEECNRQIRVMADQLGTTPSNVVDSNAMRVVRFAAVDGSVLVTCDAVGEKMIVVKSPHGS